MAGSGTSYDNPNLNNREKGCFSGLAVILILVVLWICGLISGWIPLTLFIVLVATMIVLNEIVPRLKSK